MTRTGFISFFLFVFFFFKWIWIFVLFQKYEKFWHRGYKMGKLTECSQLCVLKRACMFVFGTRLLTCFIRSTVSPLAQNDTYNMNLTKMASTSESRNTPLPSNNMVGCWASCESSLGFGPYGFHWLLWWDNREFCRTVPLRMLKLYQTGMEGLERTSQPRTGPCAHLRGVWIKLFRPK